MAALAAACPSESTRCAYVLAFGGSGKTHLLCALGQELVYQGRRVLFRPCSLRLQGSVSPEESLRAHRVDFLVPLRA